MHNCGVPLLIKLLGRKEFVHVGGGVEGGGQGCAGEGRAVAQNRKTVALNLSNIEMGYVASKCT